MSNNLFDIYFSGKLLPETDEAKARAKIGTMFKASDTQLAKLFSGESNVIKRNVNMDKAVKYRLAFREIGALVDIKPAGAAPKKASPPKPTSPHEPEEIVITAPVDPDDSDSEFQEPLDVRIAHLSLAPLGSDVIMDPPIEKVIDFDTSAFETLPLGQGSLEDCVIAEEPVSIPDVSHLTSSKTDQ